MKTTIQRFPEPRTLARGYQLATSTCVALLTLLAGLPVLRAHDHLAAGAASTVPGAPLVFVNDADFGGDSGFVFNLEAGTPDDPYLGFYYTDELVFVALAATPDDGGPEPGAAALGTHIQAQLLGIEGPSGSSFGFWETTQDGVDSTALTWSLPVPYSNGTNLIFASENDGSPDSDPYGHLHGRIYSFTEPGLYKVTWRFVDTSINGPNGGPVQASSAPFYLYYQAGLTIGGITAGINSVDIRFAAPSHVPDEDPEAPPTNYTLESSPSLGSRAVWQPVGDVIAGDDHLHTVDVPMTGAAEFFRLSAK